MPPKSIKKGQNYPSWCYCETCNIHTTMKDRQAHEKMCAIQPDAAMEKSCALDFVRDDIFYTNTVECLSIHLNDLKEIPDVHTRSLIFLSEDVIRLANFRIGQLVMIKSLRHPDLAPLVRIIWPISKKFLTTVLLDETDIACNSSIFKDSYVKIQRVLNSQIMPATSVEFALDTSSSLPPDMQNVINVLRTKLNNYILTQGNLVTLKYFNKTLVLRVQNWGTFEVSPSSAAATLEDSIKLLNINTNNEKPSFFKLTLKTRVKINYLRIDNKETSSQQQNSSSCIGGLTEQIRLIEESMMLAMGFRQPVKGATVLRSFLLYGPTGCGKSMICDLTSAKLQQISSANRMQPKIIRINTNEMFSKFLGETERNLINYFENAFSWYPQPTLIILEDVNNLCPKIEPNEIIKRVSAVFMKMLDELSSKKEAQHIFLLATTTHLEDLNLNIRRCGRLDCEIEVSAPTPDAREEILWSLLKNIENQLSRKDIKDIAKITNGFTGADLVHLVSNAAALALKENSTLSLHNMMDSMLNIKPSAMREIMIECPNIYWADIGGQKELRLKLQQAIDWPLHHQEKFKRLGITPPRGILMFGPPGCSKTMIAKALATESQANFISIKGPELFSMWVGESERAVRDVFRKARQVAPAIIFIDEIDAIGGERATGNSGASVKERVLTQLLTELDGVETLQNVTVVGATNRPDMIDNALLRPGRIDRIIYVRLPNDEARQQIFYIKTKSMPLSSDVGIEELVRRTEGYSGAEIQAVCQEAALHALQETFDAQCVEWKNFDYALQVVQPRTSPDLLRIYADYVNTANN